MSARKKILVVEDHLPLRTALEIALPDHGFAVLSAGDGDAALRAAQDGRPDLVLLDVMLPGRNGFDVCQELRRRNCGVPIIVLTAKTADEDELLSFQLGADDFVRKPFRMEALVARIKALLLRATLRGEAPRVAFGRFELDVAARILREGGRPVELTPREYALLEYFVLHPGRAFTREQLLDHVWGADYAGTDRTVDRFVPTLRQRIERDPRRPEHLRTVRTHGYEFKR